MVSAGAQGGQISVVCTQCSAKYWLPRRSLTSAAYRCKRCGKDIDLTAALQGNGEDEHAAGAGGLHALGPLLSEHRYPPSDSVSQILAGCGLVAGPVWVIYRWAAEGKLSSPGWMVSALAPALIAVAGFWLLVDAVRKRKQTIQLREGGLSIAQGTTTADRPWGQIAAVQRSISRSGRQSIRLTFKDGTPLRFDQSVSGYDLLSGAIKRKTGR
jgi:hypothetical protein